MVWRPTALIFWIYFAKNDQANNQGANYVFKPKLQSGIGRRFWTPGF